MDVPQSDFYIVIPEGVLGLGMGPIAVYAALRSFADHRTGEAWPSVSKIGERVGLSAPTTRKHLEALRLAGFIEWKVRHVEGGAQTSNHYTVRGTPKTLATPRKKTGEPPYENLSPPPQETCDELILNELILNEQKTIDQIALFDQFWQAYPRKVGKPQARKAWEKAVRRCDPGSIIDGAHAYAADPNREDQFTRHPSTWLNADGWNDPSLPQRSHGFVTTARQRLKPLLGDLRLDHNLQPRKEIGS